MEGRGLWFYVREEALCSEARGALRAKWTKRGGKCGSRAPSLILLRTPELSMTHDWLNVIRALNYTDARFVVVGALAVAAHGAPRASGDLDLLISDDPANVSKVLSAIKSVGFYVPPGAFGTRGGALMLGASPVRIDILTHLKGVSTAEAIGTAEKIPFDGTTIPVLPLPLLLASKRASGRFKDLEDIAKLESVAAARDASASSGRQS